VAEPRYLPEKTYLDPFQISELHVVISRFKANKAPGSDMIKQEWIKCSSPVFKACILQMCNQCFTAQVVPVEWTHSEVMMLPKPKTQDPLHPSANRPISLTQAFYKTYASLLKNRLQKHVEQFIRPHQFGFRPARSTSQPIHIIRRTLELFERTQDSLHLVFLDWS
jgi:hypothetical protein